MRRAPGARGGSTGAGRGYARTVPGARCRVPGAGSRAPGRPGRPGAATRARAVRDYGPPRAPPRGPGTRSVATEFRPPELSCSASPPARGVLLQMFLARCKRGPEPDRIPRRLRGSRAAERGCATSDAVPAEHDVAGGLPQTAAPGLSRNEPPGGPAARPPGDQATRRPGGQATRRPGDPATRRPGDQAARRPGGHAATRPGDHAAGPRSHTEHRARIGFRGTSVRHTNPGRHRRTNPTAPGRGPRPYPSALIVSPAPRRCGGRLGRRAGSLTGAACMARIRTSRQDMPSLSSAGMPIRIAVVTSTACRITP